MMESISWTVHTRNEEELHRFQEENNILRTIKRKRPTGLVTSYAGRLLKHVTERKIEGKIDMAR
jgi:hypothetical protein